MAKSRQLLLLSSSKVHGTGYLEHAAEYIKQFLSKNNVSKILFVPYANVKDQDGYTNTIREAFAKWGYDVEGIHRTSDPVAAVKNAQAIFIGGGNTFHLLKNLYDYNLIDPIRDQVLKNGIPYMGSSAGSNVATASISTTNDMPIVFPPSFKALNLVPFNINPHYIEPQTNGTHMGETRDERINQFHEIEGNPPVLGLKEGCILKVEGTNATICGITNARLFISGQPARDLQLNENLDFLL